MINKKKPPAATLASKAGVKSAPANPEAGSTAKETYKVGYKKPPLHTQFKPNQSGNPKGRPIKPRPLEAILAEELRRTVTVTIDGKPIKLSQGELVVKSVMRRAMAGDLASARAVLAGWSALPPDVEAKVSVSKDDLKLLHTLLAEELAADGGCK